MSTSSNCLKRNIALDLHFTRTTTSPLVIAKKCHQFEILNEYKGRRILRKKRKQKEKRHLNKQIGIDMQCAETENSPLLLIWFENVWRREFTKCDMNRSSETIPGCSWLVWAPVQQWVELLQFLLRMGIQDGLQPIAEIPEDPAY